MAATAAPARTAELAFDGSKDETLVVRLSGAWTTDARRPRADAIDRHLDAGPQPRRVAFEAAGLTAWDSGLLTFLLQVVAATERRGVAIDRDGQAGRTSPEGHHAQHADRGVETHGGPRDEDDAASNHLERREATRDDGAIGSSRRRRIRRRHVLRPGRRGERPSRSAADPRRWPRSTSVRIPSTCWSRPSTIIGSTSSSSTRPSSASGRLSPNEASLVARPGQS